MVSCSQNEVCYSLKTAEDIIDDNPDSTLSILREIDYDALKDNQLKALYGLLYTSANIKKQKVPDNDSILDYSIKIFVNNNDSYHLADSYYYKGMMSYVKKQFEVSAQYLKKAESLSIEDGYSRITNKIYERLSYLNYITDNKALTLEYSKKFLDSSFELKDRTLISRAFVMVASSYAAVNLSDSAYYYLESGLKYINDVDSVLKADILVDVGEMYYEEGEIDMSKNNALQSDFIHPNPHAKMLLGKIEYLRGDTIRAKEYWDHALSINDVKIKKELYKMVANYYAEVGNYNDAYTISLKLDSLNDTINKSSKTVQELQLKFDRAKSESELYQKILYTLIIAFLASIVLLVFLRFHQRTVRSYNSTINTLTNKNETYKSEIESFSEKVNMYQHEIGLYVSKVSNYEEEISKNIEKIKMLKTSDRSKQKEIDELKDSISTLYKSIMSELQKGHTIYEVIKNKKPIIHYSDEDLNSLVDFYKIINIKVFSSWLERYTPLSVRQYVFLILEDLGYDDYDVADVLGVSDTTVRSTRSRIKKKTRL
jgi:tetratricopeptide (TPR) repeat protein